MSNAPAADYAVIIIEALADSPSLMGLADISHITGINKNAISRVLTTLVERGWVYQDGLKYQLTLKPFRVASGALSRITFNTAAQPSLAKLWERTGDSCYIGVLHSDSVLYLGHMDSVRDLKIAGRVGGSYPLATSAPGKVLLSYMDEEMRWKYYSSLGWNENEITALEDKLSEIRERGWATDIEEYGPGIICFAAPVFDMCGKVVGTIGMSTSTVYCDTETMINVQGKEVLAAAREISEKLGAVI